MFVAIILALMGLLLVYLEFYIPGGIMATIGAMMGFAGLTLTFYVDWRFGIVFSLVEIAAFAYVIRLALRSVQKHNLCLSEDQEGYTSSTFDATLIGREGVVIKDLKPSGYIEVGGVRCQAVSEGEYLKKDTKITVINGEGAHLIVR